VTNDDDIGRKLMLLRDHGRDENGVVVTWGKNCRLDNLQAAILSLKLRTFGDALERRRAIGRRYDAGLKDVRELLLPPAPDSDPDHHDVFQNYEIEADRRDALKVSLEADGIRTIVQFGGRAVHQFVGLGFEGIRLPYTERVYERALLLPMNTTLSDDDVDYIVACIRRFYGYGS
jgi:dTDP-4-amino-4,6-dideoxygalactose transaminase